MRNYIDIFPNRKYHGYPLCMEVIIWALKAVNIIVRYRRFIIINTLLVTIAAVLISFLLPEKYRSQTIVLPPESQTSYGGLSDLSAGHIAQAITNFSLPLMATPSDLYASMIESESILKAVVDSLALQDYYQVDSAWDAVSLLRNDLEVRVKNDGMIVVKVESHDGMLTARIANALIYQLDKLNVRFQNKKGRDYSSFLFQRLQETSVELGKAQVELLEFQESHMAVSLELQSEALIDNLSQQKATLTSAEIELEILKKTLYPDHPDIARKQLIIEEIKNKLREIEQGASNSTDSILSAMDIPLAKIPDLSIQFAVLKRNVRIQELTYELLSQQLEMARLQERRDTPTISVLDIARPSKTPFRPRKARIAVAALLLSFFASIGLAIARDAWWLKENESPEVVTQIRDMLVTIRKKPLG